MSSSTSPTPAVGRAGGQDRAGAPSLTAPGLLLGAGLGGFVDGILIHQVLQWHHMLTSTDTDNIGVRYYPDTTVHGLEINTLWDGFFHTATWLLVLVGLALLYSRSPALARAGVDLARPVGLGAGRVGPLQPRRGRRRPPPARLSTTCAADRTRPGGTLASWRSVLCCSWAAGCCSGAPGSATTRDRPVIDP